MSEDGERLEPRLQLVAALLRSQSTLTLSTCDDDGWPQATPLFYDVGQDLRLYWLSSPHSAHSRQISREKRASVAVSRPTDHWREICGVQMRGEVSVVTGEARKKVTRLYRQRFRLGPMFALVIAKNLLFEFRPSWLRYLDNARGLGYKFEIELPPPGA